MNKNAKIIIALVLGVLLALGGYYYHQQQKLRSPEYSLGLLQTATAKHNWLKANERMDLDALYVQAFDEVITPQLVQLQNGIANDVVKDVLGRMRDNFVKAMVSYSKYALEANDVSKIAPPEQIFARRFIDTTHLPYCYISKIHSSTIKGKTATVTAALTNKLLAQEFPFSVTMEQLPDNTWKVIKVNKLPELITAMEQAQEEKLVVVNEPIRKKIEQELTIKPSTFALTTRTEPWKATAFTYTPTFNFVSHQSITRFMGQVEVLDKNGKVLYGQKYIEEGPFASGSKQQIRFSWTLNPFQGKEKALMELQTKELNIRERILSVTFADNSTLQILDTLPHIK